MKQSSKRDLLIGIVIFSAPILWILSPCFHKVEIKNATGVPLHDVSVALGSSETRVAEIAPGAHFRHTFFRIKHGDAYVKVSATMDGERVAFEPCGYIQLLPTKVEITIRGHTFGPRGEGCEWNTSLTSWLL